MSATRKLLAFIGTTIGIYTVFLRPRILRWGATDEEVARPYPGADLVEGGTRSATFAVTIDAPPDRIWPWLVQMGTDRGGWYSWDRLDNWGHKSADRVHPEWQAVKVGDRFISMPSGDQWWEVAAIEPERFLALRASIDLRGRMFDPHGPRPRYFTDSTWCWVLEPLPDGRTRIIESGYWAFEPRWLKAIVTVLLIEPEHWVMQTRQFANLKRLVERGTPISAENVATPNKVELTEALARIEESASTAAT